MRHLKLALQGGGSHGAFTWGVLDRLLEHGGFAFEGISGTSAGALNAAALASGWAGGVREGRDPADAARECLRAVWDDVAALGALTLWHRRAAAALTGLGALRAAAPLAFNPLHGVLQRRIDVDALRSAGAPAVFVAATQVRTGRAVVFSGSRLTIDALLASACLPQFFPAVHIDGEPYWDGGYSVNPPLVPLALHCPCPDLLLVQINPLRRDEPSGMPGAIDARSQEIAFNAGLLSQLRALAHMNELAGAAAVDWQPTFLHRIDGGAVLRDYPHASRAEAEPALVRELFRLGREAASQWMREVQPHLGRRSSVDVRAEYADDSWIPLARVPRPRGQHALQWLCALLQRAKRFRPPR